MPDYYDLGMRFPPRPPEEPSELALVTAAKDAAYSERDMLVAALSKVFPAHLAEHEGEWEEGWRTIVCVHLPTGQATWHVHDSERGWFGHLRVLAGHWDGHTVEEKYDRLARLAVCLGT
jgi:hypothetical protein